MPTYHFELYERNRSGSIDPDRCSNRNGKPHMNGSTFPGSQQKVSNNHSIKTFRRLRREFINF